MKIIVVLIVALSIVAGSVRHAEKDWWEVSAFYQIYPRSFQDSDGDGIGDLRGITSRLPYLKELGINATWLSPIFKSPMADFGYDISSFYEIQPEYGSMEDFEELIKVAKELGIRIILDFVPNHSSDENEWFIKSANRVPEYEDFYIWHPGYPDADNSSRRLPPTNWLSTFRGSAWEWNEQRQEFYYHNFLTKQPDLNYRNPFVVATMKQVLWYWLDKGVAGFRIDAVPALFEIAPDANGYLPDEPISGTTNDTADPSYLLHPYTLDQPETINMVYQWRNLVDTYQVINGGETRVLMTEAYARIDILMKYYGDSEYQNGAHMPFNFHLITNLKNTSTAHDVKAAIDIWLDNIPKGRTPNWVIGNHDQRRVSYRLGYENRDSIAMIELTLPGISVTYYGDEIGMTDVYISWEDTVDPAACNSNPDIFDRLTRDPARTPFQWDNTTNAGFSTANKTWLPVAPNYLELNAKTEQEADESFLKIYQQLFRLRQTHTLQYGDYQTMVIGSDILVVVRSHPELETYVTVANWGSTVQTLNLITSLRNVPATLQYEIVSTKSIHKRGDRVSSSFISLQPHEAFVLRTPK